MPSITAPRRFSNIFARGAAIAVAVALAGTLAAAAPAGASRAGSARAARLVNQAFAASEAASSVTINATLVSGSKRTVLHVSDVQGGNGFGLISAQGQTFRIIQIGPVNYFKAGAGYWAKVYGSKNALPVSLYANHWVKSSETGFQKFVDMTVFLERYHTHVAKWTIAGRSRFRGLPVTVLKGTQGNMTGTLLVAAKGPPYLMAIYPPQGQGSVTFSNWNKPVKVQAPSRWLAFTAPSTGGSSPSS